MAQLRVVAPHQTRALARLDTWWKSKAAAKRHGYVAMPTGSGKTFTAVKFAVDRILEPRRHPCVVWVAHSEFLLAQAQQEFERQLKERGLSDQIAVARLRGDGTGIDANVNLAMIQTLCQGDLVKRLKKAGDVDVVIFDEFHRLAADTWRQVPRQFQRADIRTLGLSATPFRKTADKTEVLREILPHRVFSVGLSELVRSRYLAEPAVRRVLVKNPRPVELDDAERKHLRQFHQLKQSVLDRIADQVGRDSLIVETYKKDQPRFRSTIVFCCSVQHAEHLARHFREAGIGAESICGAGKDPINQEKLARFRRQEFPVATSVVLLTEGVDVPACRTVFLARPCESPVLVTQMIGRAMRGERAGGSASCSIVDFVDILSGLDMSASHHAFVRDHDERIRHLIQRPPSAKSPGISVALLLRIREFLSEALLRRGGAAGLGKILEEEIVGWLEYWDGHMHRVLLIPRKNGEQIRSAFLRTLEGVEKGRASSKDAYADAGEIARAAFDEEALDEAGVSEEDFVGIAVAAAGKSQSKVGFYDLRQPSTAKQGADALTATAEVEEQLRECGAASDFKDALEALSAALAARTQAQSTGRARQR